MAALSNGTALMQARPPVKDFTSTTTNGTSGHKISVAQPRSRNFKHKLSLVTPFLSRVNHKQLLSHTFLHHSGNSFAALASGFEEGGRKGTRGNVVQNEGTVKALAADGNGQSFVSKPSEMVVCFGEMLIDFVPTIGGVSLAKAPAFKKAPGGAPANVAVGVARLGGAAAFVGKVGDDEFGYMLVDMLKENRVETRGVRFDPHARTGLAFVTLTEEGEREFMFFRNPSADMLFETQEVDMELVQQASVLHFGSISLIAEPCRSAHLATIEAAKKAGVLLSYDPNLRLPLWPTPEAALEGMKSVWDKADIIKVSEEEITFLTAGMDPYTDEAALTLFLPSTKLLLVTEGSDGCRYYCKNFSGRVDTLKVTPVDTTGAGDAFVAGLLSQIVRDMSILEDETKLREALKFANACGAIATTERGAIPALPDRDTVARLLSTVTV